MKRAALALALLLPALAGCGWHLVGKGTSLDPRIKVIAIPAFENNTDRDHLVQILTEAVVNEFVKRGRYSIVSNPANADAVLEGTISTVEFRATELDEEGRAIRALVAITADLRFRNRVADRVTWANSAFTYSQEFDVPATSTEYLEQHLIAVEEIGLEFAASVVSSIVEGF
jgi:hypothetical protein